ERIAARSRYVTVLTGDSRALWRSCFGDAGSLMLVPGAVDAVIPARRGNPYPREPGQRCLFAGHIYDRKQQGEAHEVLVDKLNRLGGLLGARQIRLYVIGEGDASRLDPDRVTHLGAVPYP